MANCPHCKSEVKRITNQQHYCSFCEMIVMIEDGIKPFRFRGAVDHVDAAKSTKDLINYHTFDLILLLKFCRQERRDIYKLMQTIGNVKHESKEFAEGYKEAFEIYSYWTKKTRVLESLVKGRIGSIPKAVTNELIDNFYSAFQESNLIPDVMYA